MENDMLNAIEDLFNNSSINIQEEKPIEKEIPVKEVGEKNSSLKEPEVIQDNSSVIEEDEVETSDNSNEKDLLILYADAFKEAGIIPEIDMKEYSTAKPGDRIQMLLEGLKKNSFKEAQDIVADYIEDMPDKFKRAFKHWNEGLEVEEAFELSENVERYSSITDKQLENDETLARKILMDDKLARGITKEEAEEEIDEIIDIVKAAKKTLPRLIRLQDEKAESKKKSIEKEELTQQERAKENLTIAKNFVNGLKEIIPGIPITNEEKRILWDSMMSTTKNKNGEVVSKIIADREKDPLKFDTSVHYFYNITKGFTDFSKVSNKAKNNAIAALERNLEKDSYKSKRNSGSSYSMKELEDKDAIKEMKDFFAGM